MRKKCPYSGSRCIQERCALWLEFGVSDRNVANGPVTMRGHCAHAWSAIFAYDANFKLLGNQAAIESFRNETTARHDSIIARQMASGPPLRVIESERDPDSA